MIEIEQVVDAVMQHGVDDLTESDEVVAHPADALPVTLGLPIEKCDQSPRSQIELANEELRSEQRARRRWCEDPHRVDDGLLLDVEPARLGWQ